MEIREPLSLILLVICYYVQSPQNNTAVIVNTQALKLNNILFKLLQECTHPRTL
jgi:hypothetical protein